MGWLSGWTYRQKITINNSDNPSDLNDYQVCLDLSSMHSDLWNVLSDETIDKSVGYDLRVTESDGTTLVKIWRQNLDKTTKTGKLWIKINIAASSTKDYYVYTSNPSASDISNGSDVFNFFDDFNFFTPYIGNPIISPGAEGEFDEYACYDPLVIKVGNEYWIYYSAYLGTQHITEGLAISSDGINFTKYGKILDTGPAGSWDDLKAHDCAVVRESDGSFKMWYSGTRDPEETYGLKIGLATSPDGKNWTKDPDNPVFDKGSPGSWDDKHVVYPSVIKEGDTYYMWYSGWDVAGARYKGIGLATSTDGKNWTREPTNPVLAGIDFFQSCISKIGDKYWMAYSKTRPDIGYGGQGTHIYLAFSTDKINWTQYENNPYIGPGKTGSWNQDGAEGGDFFKYSDAITLFYCRGVSNLAEARGGIGVFKCAGEYDLSTKWTEYIDTGWQIAVSNKEVRMTGDGTLGEMAHITSKENFSPPIILETKSRTLDITGQTQATLCVVAADLNNFIIFAQSGSTNGLLSAICKKAGTHSGWQEWGTVDNLYHIFKIIWTSDSKFYLDNNLQKTIALTYTPIISLPIQLKINSYNDESRWDWVFAREYTDPEPTSTWNGVDIVEVPVANFSGNPTQGIIPLIVQFTDLSTNTPTSWLWNFGDGETSIQQNPQHTYDEVGTYTVSLIATNDAGPDTEEKINYITAKISVPVTNFSGNPTSGLYPLTVQFSDLSTNTPTSWLWDFGDGATSTEQNPSHIYTEIGTYTVSLIATNETGSNTKIRIDYIEVLTLICNFSGEPLSGKYPLQVHFTDLSISIDPITWLWNFGDGETSEEQNPIHTYNSEGTFTVSLTITNGIYSDTETKEGYITTSARSTSSTREQDKVRYLSVVRPLASVRILTVVRDPEIVRQL